MRLYMIELTHPSRFSVIGFLLSSLRPYRLPFPKNRLRYRNTTQSCKSSSLIRTLPFVPEAPERDPDWPPSDPAVGLIRGGKTGCVVGMVFWALTSLL